jgi:hypothetical protein
MEDKRDRPTLGRAPAGIFELNAETVVAIGGTLRA